MNSISKIYYRDSLLVFFLLISNLNAGSLESFDHYFKSSSLGAPQKKASEHFEVSWVHPRDEIIVPSLLQHLEAADKDLSVIFRDSSGARKKVPVEIFPDLKSFSEVSKLSLARFKATGTIALTLDQRLMILSPRNLISGYSWAVTVVHEYTHYLIREISADNIPIWLHEGVAQLFQSYPYIKEMKLTPSQWGLFRKSKAKKALLSLETLREPFPYRKTAEEAELAYIEALLFSNWLNQKCGVLTLIRSAEQMKSIDKALTKCTGWSETVLSQKFIPEILSKVPIPEGKAVEFFARDLGGGDPLEIEGRKTEKKSRDFAQLSTELFKQGRYSASARELEKAFQETPVKPPSWQRQLAIALNKSGDSKKSQTTLEQLVKEYPEDAAAWYLLADHHLKNQDQKLAWIAYVKAFFVNPFLDGLEDQMKVLQERNPSFSYSFF